MYGCIKAVGMVECGINDMGTSLLMLRYENVARAHVCLASGIEERA